MSTPSPSLWARVRRRLAQALHHRRFRRSVRHLSGPGQPLIGPGDVVVIALVRDGAFYLDAFLAHYRGLGAAHFVFCDNGSTDDTLTRLATQPDCTVLQSTLPWGEVENDLRRHAAETCAPGHWVLYADMDEIFTFDRAAQIGLPGLVAYLEREGYTALVAQMLEMFPRLPLQDAGQMSYEEALREFVYYDLRDTDARDYHDPGIGFAWFLAQNRVANAEIPVLFGGTRARVFGEACCLTKHPLVKVLPGVAPGVHPHVAAGVTCADFSALIQHYKFTNAPMARDADTAARGVIPHGEDRRRLEQFRADPDLTLWSEQAERFAGLRPLQDAGFLQRSAAFEAYLREIAE
ncbi:glycosyltransferase family 2 protein [Roseovarius faecimaris]|uniref:Glycosyltransferase family 2 protein n=1 Tax=Roseovarius faecimaris TaxID=2494550 RepID=A0A6I6IUD6_9RHOB|nr:glycosyltransferase family 2 protein [Roseovarius faecimaris]QGX99513.1 glycosyltransferase family 2 protein [Roseovarius faecimaris]